MSGLFSSKGVSTKDKTSITTFKHQDLVVGWFYDQGCTDNAELWRHRKNLLNAVLLIMA